MRLPRRRFVVLAMLALATALLPAPPAAAEVARTVAQEVPLGEALSAYVVFPNGNVAVEGYDGSAIAFTIDVECSVRTAACGEEAAKVGIYSKSDGRKLKIRVTGPQRSLKEGPKLVARLQVPHALLFSLDMGLGNLTVSGLENVAELDVTAGDAEVRIPEAAVRSVYLKANVGEATLHMKSGRIQGTGILHKSLKWVGTGAARVEVSVGTGDADLTLE